MVFGVGNTNEVVIRKGYAEQATIKRAPVYVATVGDPEFNKGQGIPIENLVEEDLPEEYSGLVVYQINPLRPLVIEEKKKEEGGTKIFDKIAKKYESDNIALIQTPKEKDWAIAVLKYLSLCDQDFPDTTLQTIYSKIGYGGGIYGTSSNFIN